MNERTTPGDDPLLSQEPLRPAERYEPGEDWFWCYVDELAFEISGAPPAPSHP